MGREVRQVPPGWEHPRYTADDALRPNLVGELRPCFDIDYETAAEEWIKEFHEWKPTDYCQYYWEHQPPPDEETCRPKFTEDPTWFQLYETVTEGTPISPPFATREELAQWYSENGDPVYGRLPIDQARKFVGAGWAPSMVVQNGKPMSGGEFVGREQE